jgi:hypothetical protein
MGSATLCKDPWMALGYRGQSQRHRITFAATCRSCIVSKVPCLNPLVIIFKVHLMSEDLRNRYLSACGRDLVTVTVIWIPFWHAIRGGTQYHRCYHPASVRNRRSCMRRNGGVSSKLADCQEEIACWRRVNNMRHARMAFDSLHWL